MIDPHNYEIGSSPEWLLIERIRSDDLWINKLKARIAVLERQVSALQKNRREKIAKCALTGLLASNREEHNNAYSFAALAVIYADEVIEQLDANDSLELAP